jgi:hypothetical protein
MPASKGQSQQQQELAVLLLLLLRVVVLRQGVLQQPSVGVCEMAALPGCCLQAAQQQQ